MEAYSLNPQILPGKPLSHEEHHRAMVWLVCAIIILVLAGAFYMHERSLKPAVAPVDQQAAMEAKISALLQEKSTTPPSQTEVDKIASLLTAQSSPPTEAEKEKIASALKAKP